MRKLFVEPFDGRRLSQGGKQMCEDMMASIEARRGVPNMGFLRHSGMSGTNVSLFRSVIDDRVYCTYKRGISSVSNDWKPASIPLS